MVLPVLALMAAASLPAAVDGTVTNGTTGKPQAGATVTLYKLGQAGPDALESVKSDAQGRFRIERDLPEGPNLIETAFDGVTYNHMLRPGSSGTGLRLEVFNASERAPGARVAQHIVLLEPAGDQLQVGETFFFRNEGKLTHNDPKDGTLRFHAPEGAQQLRVMATAPQGVPIQRAAEKAKQANVYWVDFPIKPGETRIDVTYATRLPEDGAFSGRVFFKGGPTRLVVPQGVTLEGEGLENLGDEPTTRATIYEVKDAAYTVRVKGATALRADAAEDAGPSVQQILPRVYESMAWILIPAFLALTLGFILLYRSSPQAQSAAPAPPKRKRQG
jgi:hypothetical protein